MKVKDIMPKKNKMENEFRNLQLLEKFLQNNPIVAEDLAEQANCTLPLSKLITEARMVYSSQLVELEEKIQNAEIQE